jgi:hypothetical protein
MVVNTLTHSPQPGKSLVLGGVVRSGMGNVTDEEEFELSENRLKEITKEIECEGE